MMVSKMLSFPFMTALLVFGVQVGTFLLLTLNELSNSSTSQNPLGLPVSVTPAVRITQIIAITITVFTQDDVRTGIMMFYKGYPNRVDSNLFHHLSRSKFVMITLARIVEGGLGLMVTFLLIVSASTVIDLLLNFTAMEFVSQLDEIYFALSLQGFLGKRNQTKVDFIQATPYEIQSPSTDRGRRRKSARFYLILAGIWICLMVAWTMVMIRQTNGTYLCQSLMVQFEDDFVSSLGAFSGIYDLDGERVGMFENARVRYIERKSGKAAFAYCPDMNAWTFGFAEDGHFPDPCDDWVAHSDDSDTFDIQETRDHKWMIRNPHDQIILIEHFHMSCLDCDIAREGAGECHGRGECSNGICECNEGWFGLRCEFHEPCTSLEMDIRYEGFEDAREWSRTFDIFKIDNNTVHAYHRPVHLAEPTPGNFDIITFTGRRWMATHTDVFLSAGLDENDDPEQRRRLLAQYFADDFHAYWSNFTTTFLTSPVDIGTESDSAEPVDLHWYVARPKSKLHLHDLQSIDHSVASLDAVLLCTICNEENNLCLYDGVCANGSCQCDIGSFGSLCQIPPIGNGRCDPKYDIPKYDYDGGDCCESTCISGDVYHCGKDVTGFIDTGYFFCTHEADRWHLNRASFQEATSSPHFSLSLSADGHILALGEPNADHVTLFDADGSAWIKRGRVLDGPLGSHFGGHIAISKGLKGTVQNPLKVDPVRIAVSGRRRNEGFVRVYECLAQGCAPIGNDIIFNDLLLDSRTVHDISNDGRIVAFGGYSLVTNMTTVDFYHYEENLDDWTSQGISTLEFPGDAYGLTLSGSFETLAIRSMIIWEGVGVDEYHREFLATDAKGVFHYNGGSGTWEQFGSTIYDQVDGKSASFNPDDFHILGTRHRLSEFLHGSDAIALSSDGLVMAAGFPFSVNDAGVHVFVFDEKETGEWVPRGSTITNNHTHGFKGWSVSLSGNGDVIAIGTGGDETGTNTYIWDIHNNMYVKYGEELPGSEQSSVQISDDGSVLAVARESVDTYHRNVQPACPDGTSWLHFSLTLDTHPEDTRFDLVSNVTGKVFLEGGPYVGSTDGDFPYSDAYERATIVAKTCIPKGECILFSLYDKLDPLVDVFKIPDGMLTPSIYNLSIDGKEFATRRLDQAVDHLYIGESCTNCPEGTHLLKVLVRSCVPFSWTLTEASIAGATMSGTNDIHDFAQFTYVRDGTCQHLNRTVHSYWKEACLHVADLEHDCFNFHLGTHPSFPVVPSTSEDVELDHAHRNTEVVILFDSQQIHVDLALVGSIGAGPPSDVHFSFGGSCSNAASDHTHG